MAMSVFLRERTLGTQKFKIVKGAEEDLSDNYRKKTRIEFQWKSGQYQECHILHRS